MRAMGFSSFFSTPIAILLCTFYLSFFLENYPAVLILDDRSGEQIASFPLQESEFFSISFVHSVNQSIVEEKYQRRKDEIFLVSCRYFGLGAGVLTEITDSQTLSYLEDGSMVVSNIDARMNYLSYIVGTISDHVLHIGGRDISLRDLCGKNRVIQFICQ